jgi:hypothetical protein
MKNLSTILISGIGKRNAFIRLLRTEANKHDIKIIGCDAQDFPPARFEVDQFQTLPLATDSNFSERLKELLLNAHIKGYMTLIDYEIVPLGILSGKSPELNSQYLHPVPSTSVACEDKYEFFLRMTKAGIPVIPTALKPSFPTPYICKDRRGSAASGFRIFKTIEDANEVRAHQANSDLIFQPFCTAQHHCVDAYFSLATGELIDFCAKKVLNKVKGETFLLESVTPEPFVDILKSISGCLPMRGIVNFDIYVAGSEISVMEVNCRVGGNYPASHAYGCNLLNHLMTELLNPGAITKPSFSKYEIGKYIAKYLEFSAPKTL